jgi:peptidoglycan hydrolase-like protein with peptidoglycan-binding domain
MRRLLLGAASVLALGIGGVAVEYSADAGNAMPNASMPAASQTSNTLQTDPNLSKDDIRQAQLELRNQGLYSGSLDGVIGPATKRALVQFQKSTGLYQTATLDQETLDALIGTPGMGQGSSMPPNTGGVKSTTNSAGSTDLGDRPAPK